MPKLIEISAVDMTVYKFVMPLMDKLREEKWAVVVAASNTGYKDDIKKRGYKFYDIDFVRNLSPIKNLKALYQILKLIRKEKPDVIHVHTPIASVISRIAAFLCPDLNITVVYTLHGLIKKPILLQIEKFACRYMTDVIFTVNKEDKLYLIKNKFSRNPNNVINLNSVGIDIEEFCRSSVDKEIVDNIKLKFGITNTKPVITFVGRAIKEKGIRELVKAFCIVNENIDCQLLIVGPSDMGERVTNALDMEQVSKNDSIILTGRIEEIKEVLYLTDIFVLPSYTEGMCVSTLEAMAMEVPVIGTDIRGIREEVTKKTGILVSVGDVEPLAQAMETLLKNPDKAKQMGKESRERVIKHFNKDRVVLKQSKVFAIIKSRLT